MKMNKNILIVTPGKVRLTETFIRAHIEYLEGTLFYLYTNGQSFFDDKDRPVYEILNLKRKNLSPLASLLPYYFYFRLKKKYEKLNHPERYIHEFISQNHIDLVIAEYGPVGVQMTTICEEQKVPLIVHYHGFDAYQYETLKFYKEGYNRMFSYAQAIIAVSHDMKKQLGNLGCPKSKLVLNTYGPNTSYLGIEPNYFSNQIIAVGRHTFKKAPYLTILAFQKILAIYPEMKLSIVGGGELIEISRHIIKSLNLDNSVKLVGPADVNAIMALMKDSCLFVQHSLRADNGDSEGTPVAILEAMAAALPVVSTQHAGIKDVVIEGETGFLVEEGDIEGMGKAMLMILKNRDKAKALGQEGRKRILHKYSMERHIENFNNIINQVLTRGKL